MENTSTPNLENGILIDEFPDGEIRQGKVGGDDVIVARRGDMFFALGANCTHYGGPLAKGLIVGDEVRCPLHHACFSLRTGQALRGPAFDSIPCWRVERIGNTLFVREKLSHPTVESASVSSGGVRRPGSIVIVGGGAAGFAAADTLRREGYDGPVTLISADEFAPYDRPNLSKEYLTGQAPEEWIPLRSPDYYADNHIDLVLNARVSALDAKQKRIELQNGTAYDFDALLIATGADPVKIPVPGASDSHLHYLRTFADSTALARKAASATQVIVVGASFIGLEVAASLRERGIRVHVVAPEQQPLERVLGPEIGGMIRRLHETHGVVFHLGQTVARVNGNRAALSGGDEIDADFLVLGVGVSPSLSLAKEAGLKIDRGIVVDQYLETSVPGIFAAGDVARWPDPLTGQLVRIEHWVVAERQGQVAARNMLGRRERFEAVPFFWTQQFGVSMRYVGHAEKWDQVEIEGNLEEMNCAVTYKLNGRRLAVATISRDLLNLEVEAAMEASISKHAVGIA